MGSFSGQSVVYSLYGNLYLNITNRCSNDCYFCLKKFRTGVAGVALKLADEPSPDVVVGKLKEGLRLQTCREVVFCGFGEPTLRLDVLLEIAAWMKSNVEKVVRLDTNGHALLLYPQREVVKELKNVGIRKLSVSLNASDESTYNEICRPRFPNAYQKVIEFIQRSVDSGLDTEVTAVALPEIKIFKVEDIAVNLGATFRPRPYVSPIW